MSTEFGISADWLEDKFVTPWALPGESFLAYFKWNPELSVDRIRVHMEPNVVVWRVFNIDISVFPKRDFLRNSFEISSEQIQIDGFAGFEAFYSSIPDREKVIRFTVELVTKSETNKTFELAMQIVRPIVRPIGQVSEIAATEGSLPPSNVNIAFANAGKGDVLEDSMKYYFETEKTGSIDIRIENVETSYSIGERLFVRNPNRLIPNIVVSGLGHGLVKMGFEYSDRVGNKYKSPLMEILIRVEQKQKLRVPISGQLEMNDQNLALQAHPEPLMVPLRPPRTR